MNTQPIPPDLHRRQIEQYEAKRREVFERYVAVLRRVLMDACKVSFPEAVVQARAKTLSSFAEKCARRYRDYPDAVNQFTDLCGARVIVQTLEQVRAVCRFIDENFEIHERDDKALRLGEGHFGYRDMHYVVGLRVDRCSVLGITDEERDAIGPHQAEIQVRTWLQHAWADTMHDRVYKNPLDLPRDIRRTGALQAALMEEGDRNFNTMADTLDGMMANYTAFATRDEVAREVEVQRLLLESELQEDRKPAMALGLARIMLSLGESRGVVSLLEQYAEVDDANQAELLSELGFAQCRGSRQDVGSLRYQSGVERLRRSLQLCEGTNGRFVQDLRKSRSLLARAHYRLAWAMEVIPGEDIEARRHYQIAHETEPANPYHMAGMLGFELNFLRRWDWLLPMRGSIREAIETCREHAAAGIELPAAYLTAARLSLILGRSREDSGNVDRTSDDSYVAFGFYARGLQHCLDARHCSPPEVLAEEEAWIRSLGDWERLRPPFRWALELLRMRERRHVAEATEGGRLIVTGGARSMDTAAMDVVRPFLHLILESFHGVVVCGGTGFGVPGCVGDLAADFAAREVKRFKLVGYLPRGRTLHAGYDDNSIYCEENEFSPEQSLRAWKDILDEGIDPRNVMVIGFGGGRLSAADYHLGLALGATVASISGTGGASDDLAADGLWGNLPNHLPTPLDRASVRALIASPRPKFDDETLERMARAFHENYVANSAGKLPATMRPWPRLDETYRNANRGQALYAVSILEAAGFGVRESAAPHQFRPFRDEEVERMAEMEHGRWNVERLRDGWRPGSTRDNESKVHNCIVPWSELPEEIRDYDRFAIREYPEILMKAGLEIYEPEV